MQRVNVEIKAVCRDPQAVRRLLADRGADFRGTDHQVDTYFRVSSGRLKLREGRIENALIHYRRPNDAGPKRADVLLLPTAPGSPIKDVLTAALGVLVVVDKQRDIYFIDNVKFHIDEVAGLGSFVEIEAISPDDAEPEGLEETLHAQCRRYLDLLAIAPEDLVAESYSDLLLQRP
jgi:predicted adenylyl cyclase CyaB